MKKHLYYLSSSTIPSSSANSVHVMKMCAAFQRKGIQTTLFCRRGADKFKEDVNDFYGIEAGFKIRRYPTINIPGISFLTSFLYLLDVLRSNKHQTIYYGRDIPSLLLCALQGYDVIYESHGMPQKKVLAWMERMLLSNQKLKEVVFISKALKKLYSQSSYNGKSIVLHDSADQPPNHEDKIELCGDCSFNAVYIGSLYEGRGVELLMSLASTFLDVGFHLFGGEPEDIARLRKTAEASGLRNIYFYGYISPSETYKCRNSADALLMPYQKRVMTINNASETSRYMSPLKLFEYMSSRKMIVSSDHDVLKEVLTDGVNALLCDPGNIDEWREAISLAMNDKVLRDKLAQTAYEDFVKKYTWGIRANSLLREFGNATS